MMSVTQEHLEQMLKQVEHLDDDMLYSGLMILSKDIIEYTAGNDAVKTVDNNSFFEVFNETMEEERDYWEKFGNNLFVPLEQQQQSHGFAKLAMDNQLVDLMPLTNPGIHHEYFNIPGKKLFKRFAEKFKETICEKDGPRDKFKAAIKKAELPTTIATAILASGFSLAAFGYPIAIYLGLLIARTGLDVYCAPKEQRDK